MKVPLNVRVDEKLIAELREAADKQNRSLSNLVDTVLRRYLLARPLPKTAPQNPILGQMYQDADDHKWVYVGEEQWRLIND